MRTCGKCGGGIADFGEVTGWAGKWCSCGTSCGTFGSVPITPMPIQSPQEHMERREAPFMPTFTEEMKDETATKSRLVRIINMCEELSTYELEALRSVLQVMDSKS